MNGIVLYFNSDKNDHGDLQIMRSIKGECKLGVKLVTI